MPATEISVVSRGPLVEIGSFAIWTSNCWFRFKTWFILPVLTVSGSKTKLDKSPFVRFPSKDSSVILTNEFIYGPKSW